MSASASPRQSSSASRNVSALAAGVAALERGACLVSQPFEAPQVDLLGFDLEDVSRSSRGDDPRPERLAQARDMAVQGGRRRRRRLPIPELVDQPIARDDPVCVQQQEGQHGALFPASERNGAPVLPHFDRAKDAVVHRALALTLTPSESATNGR